jgi:hypothetical protein
VQIWERPDVHVLVCRGNVVQERVDKRQDKIIAGSQLEARVSTFLGKRMYYDPTSMQTAKQLAAAARTVGAVGSLAKWNSNSDNGAVINFRKWWAWGAASSGKLKGIKICQLTRYVTRLTCERGQ